ncbi:MAG: DUF4012 domain-containing protein [Patescibacteria group bacterium]
MDINQNIIQSTWREKLIKRLPQNRHILAAAIVVATLLFLFYVYQAVDAYRNARQIMALAPYLEEQVFARNWDGVKSGLKGVAANINELEGNINRLWPITALPVIKNETRAARNLLAAAEINAQSAVKVADWASQYKLLQTKELDSLQTAPEAEKQEFFAALAKSGPLWEQVDRDTKLSLRILEQSKAGSRLPLLKKVTIAAANALENGQAAFTDIRPLLPLLPKVLGYPEARTYLLLLQNNTELRPTGGFIGTFGYLTVKNGKLVSFSTENVYNLDEPAKAYNTKVPPPPIQKYLKQAQWFFRDVNWDPDFPTTAEEAIKFYHDERGPISHFDGVIAFTPRLIEDLLATIGPVTIDDNVFTAENIVAKLQYEVEVGFAKDGINIYNRKQIIDDLAQVLKERILKFKSQEIRAMLPLITQAFDEKQAMIYFTDPNLQKSAANFNWDNRIKETAGDYFYVVDANLGSLKTDPAISRAISYSLRPEAKDRSLIATVKITYTNQGKFDWKTTRYRTYTRLYVPLGSTLITAEGNEEPLAITDSHGKTVFGTFISIEPEDSETLTFSYKLPAGLVNKISQGDYSLLVQKQAGTEAHGLELDIALPFAVESVNPSVLKKADKNQVISRTNLQEDRSFTVLAK